MIRILIEKELRGVLTSPKFVTTLVVCSLLFLSSIILGIQEHAAFEEQRLAAEQLHRQELAEARSWPEVQGRAFRSSDPLYLFAAGTHFDIGRFSGIGARDGVRLRNSVFSDQPLLALFRHLDFTLVVTVVLSLLAILFTYDAVCGERESGTLKLVFANSVPRTTFILGKLVGTWLGLVLPLTIPVLLGLLLVVFSGIQLQAGDWGRLVLLLVASTLYFSFWVATGIAVSALARRPAASFMVLLALWVLLVLIVPRAGLTAATHLNPVPSVAEIEGQAAAYENAQWARFRTELTEAWRQRSASLEDLPAEQREQVEDEKTWEWMSEDDEQRKQVERDIAEHERQLTEELANRKASQVRLALGLARLSPAATYQLIAMTIAGSDQGLKKRTTDAMGVYRNALLEFIDRRSGGTGSDRRIVARRSSSGRFSMSMGEDGEPVDLSEMPQFVPARPVFSSVAGAAVRDLGLLTVLGLLAFVVAFVGFLRADIR